ncbi:hypothetical protein G1C97_1360 [Bifidobacterium sp. DSM 109959]|uniref:Uncharacterized protein n=1 Tax=Bifidobacterium olomucense TaxID=2675324 RepID=A0A7Y0EXU9_9BIFI|nr:hypothetical protein [Bifidobacterium sp. DSM 109959]
MARNQVGKAQTTPAQKHPNISRRELGRVAEPPILFISARTAHGRTAYIRTAHVRTMHVKTTHDGMAHNNRQRTTTTRKASPPCEASRQPSSGKTPATAAVAPSRRRSYRQPAIYQRYDGATGTTVGPDTGRGVFARHRRRRTLAYRPARSRITAMAGGQSQSRGGAARIRLTSRRSRRQTITGNPAGISGTGVSDRAADGRQCTSKRQPTMRDIQSTAAQSSLLIFISRARPRPSLTLDIQHSLIDLLAVGQRTVGQRMFLHHLGDGVLDTHAVFQRPVDGKHGHILHA